MNLPEINVQPTIPVGWADNESYTVKVWRNGACIQIKHYTCLQAALRATEAHMRLANAHDPKRHLSWYRLGSEIKLAADVWQEGDTVAYVTCDRIAV